MIIQKRIINIALAAAFALRLHATLPPLPQPATSFGAAIESGWLYVYGGNTGRAHEFHRDCVKGDLFRLRLPGGAEWERLPGGPALLSPALVAHAGKIIRIGGLAARNEKGAKNDLHSTDEIVRFDPATQQWEKLPPMPEPRSSHDALVVGDTLYVGGGWRLAGDDGEGGAAHWHTTALSIDLRDPARGWQSHPQPFQRRALAAAASGGRIWFLGGMDAKDEPSRAVDWWEPATGRWGKGPDLPDGTMAGFGIAGAALDGRVIASPLSGKVLALAETGAAWEEIAALASPRFFHRLLPLGDGRLLAVGGSSRKGQIPGLELIVPGEKPAAPAAPAPAPKTSAEAKQPVETSAAAWPQWRGPQRDGISTETGWRKNWSDEKPRELWRAQSGAGMSSPAIAAGRLFTHGNDGNGTDLVLALDASTGAELWSVTFPCRSEPHEMPAVPAGPGATPTVAGGHVFTLSREGDLLCLDVANGTLAWRKNLIADLGGKRPVYGYAQSPLVEGGRIFLDLGAEPGKAGSTAALDAATGEVRWRTGTGEAGYSSARIFERDGRRWLAMFKGESLDILDPADGRTVASHRTTARDFTNSTTPAFVGHRILVSNTGTAPAALLDWDTAGTEPHPAWTHKQFALLFNSAIVRDGSLFGFNEKRRGHHEFTCIDAATGDTRWVSDAASTSTFIAADGHWIFLTREGECLLAPAASDGLKITARFPALTGKCYASPALAAGRLYLRSNSGELAAFDLRDGAR